MGKQGVCSTTIAERREESPRRCPAELALLPLDFRPWWWWWWWSWTEYSGVSLHDAVKREREKKKTFAIVYPHPSSRYLLPSALRCEATLDHVTGWKVEGGGGC